MFVWYLFFFFCFFLSLRKRVNIWNKIEEEEKEKLQTFQQQWVQSLQIYFSCDLKKLLVIGPLHFVVYMVVFKFKYHIDREEELQFLKRKKQRLRGDARLSFADGIENGSDKENAEKSELIFSCIFHHLLCNFCLLTYDAMSLTC